MLAIQTMLKLLDDRLKSTGRPLQEKVVPLLSALCQLARGDRIIRRYLRREVLPPLGHVGTTRPEEGHLIRNELVRLMTSPLEDIKVCYKLFDIKYTGVIYICKHSVSNVMCGIIHMVYCNPHSGDNMLRMMFITCTGNRSVHLLLKCYSTFMPVV